MEQKPKKMSRKAEWEYRLVFLTIFLLSLVMLAYVYQPEFFRLFR